MASKKNRQNPAGNLAPAGAEGQDLSAQEAMALTIKLVGASHAFRLASQSTRVYEILTLQQIKDHGTYKQLGHTWETFCAEVLGRARRTVDDDLQSLDVFGQEFMELAEQLNLGRRALQGLRRLPEDARPRVLDSGELEVGDERVSLDDKDQVKELLEDILEGQERLRQDLRKGREQLDQAEEEKAALEARIREMENARTPADGLTEHDRQWMRVLGLLSQIVEDVQEGAEGTEPAVLKKYHSLVEDQLAEVRFHFTGYRPDSTLPEGYNPDVAEQVAREMED